MDRNSRLTALRSIFLQLNEPLSALQRLCEELEYSELLDKAASSRNSEVDRMMWVAAFAVSMYGSCQARAGHKPFNPLLGETFECTRDDHSFRYMAEQVSHHPPVSACHAHSTNGGAEWTWFQDLRVKTKFWGKSMEFQPEGVVTVILRADDDNAAEETYEWNKITTCIHNLFGGAERWVDLYGQSVIRSSTGLTCKIDFVKASYWSNKRHELHGTIADRNGESSVAHVCGKTNANDCNLQGAYCSTCLESGARRCTAAGPPRPSASGGPPCCQQTAKSITVSQGN